MYFASAACSASVPHASALCSAFPVKDLPPHPLCPASTAYQLAVCPASAARSASLLPASALHSAFPVQDLLLPPRPASSACQLSVTSAVLPASAASAAHSAHPVKDLPVHPACQPSACLPSAARSAFPVKDLSFQPPARKPYCLWRLPAAPLFQPRLLSHAVEHLPVSAWMRILPQHPSTAVPTTRYCLSSRFLQICFCLTPCLCRIICCFSAGGRSRMSYDSKFCSLQKNPHSLTYRQISLFLSAGRQIHCFRQRNHF